MQVPEEAGRRCQITLELGTELRTSGSTVDALTLRAISSTVVLQTLKSIQPIIAILKNCPVHVWICLFTFGGVPCLWANTSDFPHQSNESIALEVSASQGSCDDGLLGKALKYLSIPLRLFQGHHGNGLPAV